MEFKAVYIHMKSRVRMVKGINIITYNRVSGVLQNLGPPLSHQHQQCPEMVITNNVLEMPLLA